MRVHVKIDVDSAKAVASLQAIAARTQDTRPWLRKLATALAAAQLMNFSTKGSLAGGWAPLSPDYGLWKRSNMPGRPMMVSTGRLKASVTSRDRLVQSMTGTSMRIGSDVHYAEFHQSGTRNMPRRKVVVVPESVIKLLKRDLARYVARGRLES